MRMRSRHSLRTVRTQRSANAFAFGALAAVRITSIPSVGKTSSKPRLNLDQQLEAARRVRKLDLPVNGSILVERAEFVHPTRSPDGRPRLRPACARPCGQPCEVPRAGPPLADRLRIDANTRQPRTASRTTVSSPNRSSNRSRARTCVRPRRPFTDDTPRVRRARRTGPSCVGSTSSIGSSSSGRNPSRICSAG
jgi:hypothetical protein